MDDFSPREGFENAVRNWWLVVLLVFWGGFLGWLIHRAQPPLYQAEASFNISLNFQQTGQLSQFDEDHAYNHVGDLIKSSDVIAQVVQAARSQGLPVSIEDFKQSTILERREYVWVLIVRRNNPQEAMILANLWADKANSLLTNAHTHSLNASQQQVYLDALENCLSSPRLNLPSPGVCTGTDLPALQAEIRLVSDQLTQENIASQGLFPALTVALTQRASFPVAPSALGTNTMTLAGALIGFIIAVWVVQIRLPARLARRLGHA
ncbi:MAG TPA: hypothetical protein VF813_10355 [Anaerolineaceae bacterium]